MSEDSQTILLLVMVFGAVVVSVWFLMFLSLNTLIKALNETTRTLNTIADRINVLAAWHQALTEAHQETNAYFGNWTNRIK